MPVVLVGSLLNARACAAAALELAGGLDLGVGIVCAGQQGRVALDDAVAAGVIVARLVELAQEGGVGCALSDAAQAARALVTAYPDPLVPLRASWSGRLLHALGADEDVEWCARLDASRSVPVLRSGPTMRIEGLQAPR